MGAKYLFSKNRFHGRQVSMSKNKFHGSQLCKCG